MNHRHADFQSSVISSGSIASNRNSVKPAPSYQPLSPELSNSSDRIDEAALYLAGHRQECLGRAIPSLKRRFGLRNIEAIEATKRAHAIEFGGGE